VLEQRLADLVELETQKRESPGERLSPEAELHFQQALAAYSSIVTRVDEVSLSNQLSIGLEMWQPAVVSGDAGIEDVQTYGLALIIGLALGVVGAVGVDGADRPVVSGEEVAEALGTHEIARIAAMKGGHGSEASSEGTRLLRLRVGEMIDAEDVKSILLAPLTPESLPSSVVADVCRGLARSRRSIVLICADVASRETQTSFGLDGQMPGLLDALERGVPFGGLLVSDEDARLRILPVGVSSDDGSTLLESAMLRRIIDEATGLASVTVVVCDSIADGMDAGPLSQAVDGIILTLRPQSAKRSIADRTRRVLGSRDGALRGVVIVE
jgi:hypothetical protein